MLLIRRSSALVALAAALLAYPLAAAAQTPQTRWYLAEGSTGPFFQEDILIANPGAQAATVRVQLFRESGGTPIETTYTVAATSRTRLRVNDTVAEGPVAAIVESTNNVPIVVERTMYWQSMQGGHNALGVEAPSTTWYLAEGAANGFFDTFILVSSPQTTATTATLTLQREDGFTQAIPIALGPLDRETVYVNTDPRTTAFAGSSFSASVTATQPIFVERAMYFQGFKGGHDATAVAAPGTTWLFAEGFTGSDFNTFFLINNTANATATVTLTYFLDNGTTVTRNRTVGARARETVYANADAALQHAAFATRITSTQPIVAERAMYWGGFAEGHATAGVQQLAGTWGFAEGLADTNFGVNFETFYLFLNPSAQPIAVRGFFYREDGTGSVQDFTIAANSRYTLYGASVAGMSNQKFAAFFRSLTAGAQFTVERAVYWGPGRGGHVSVGVPFSRHAGHAAGRAGADDGQSLAGGRPGDRRHRRPHPRHELRQGGAGALRRCAGEQCHRPRQHDDLRHGAGAAGGRRRGRGDQPRGQRDAAECVPLQPGGAAGRSDRPADRAVSQSDVLPAEPVRRRPAGGARAWR